MATDPSSPNGDDDDAYAYLNSIIQGTSSAVPSDFTKPIVDLIENAGILHKPDEGFGRTTATASPGSIEGDDDLKFDEGQPDKKKKKAHRKVKPRRSDLKPKILSECKYFKSRSGEVFVEVPVADGYDYLPLQSGRFKDILADAFESEFSFVPGEQALQGLLRVLCARARRDGVEQDPVFRVLKRENEIYIDCANAARQAVKIDVDGYALIKKRGLPLVQTPRTLPLCVPEEGYSVDELKHLFEFASDDDFVLVIGFVLMALSGQGPFPILNITGEYGSAKSTLCRFLRSLIDPSVCEDQGPPKDVRDYILVAQNGLLIVLDNLSTIEGWLSDLMCRLSTGGGFSTKANYTDKDEVLFSGMRPQILNGVTDFIIRSDLASRVVTIRMLAIPEERRLPDDDLIAAMEVLRPRLLGAIFDGLSSALRSMPTIKLKTYTRMAMFEKTVTAAEPGLGWETGTFIKAYRANVEDFGDTVFEANLVAVALRDWYLGKPDEDDERRLTGGWRDAHPDNPTYRGEPTELLAILNESVKDSIRQLSSWPKVASSFGNAIKLCKPLLRQKGIIVETKKTTGGRRQIVIARSDDAL